MSQVPRESEESIQADCFPKVRHRMKIGPDAILNTKFLFHLVVLCTQDGAFASLRLGVPIQKMEQ